MNKQTNDVEPNSEISLEKRYELIREQIIHEDGLINQRLNWLLLSQGFLFAAFTTIITNIDKFSKGLMAGSPGFITPANILWPLLAIAMTGLLLNYISFNGLKNAYRSLKYLRDNWHNARPLDKKGQK